MSEQVKKAAGAGTSLRQVAEKCVGCAICGRDCLYLQQYGLPGSQARAALNSSMNPRQPFFCSLCGLCREVCPKGLDPPALFMSLRVQAVAEGQGEFKEHRVLKNYERRGGSPLFSWCGLPGRCTTVFFPGCSLPGTRSGRVLELYQELSRTIPHLGLVLDCCTKPSHDLGRQKHFRQQFGHLLKTLLGQGISKVLVACPNCYRMFNRYGRGITVQTIYEVLADTFNWAHPLSGTVTVHDPCGVRDQRHIHAAVRQLIRSSGLQIEEMKHHGSRTLCCGEGGGVSYLDQQFSAHWGKLRQQEVNGRRIITYCAGCTGFLGPLTPTSHVVDLLFEPETTLKGQEKVAVSPFTYINRLILIQRLKKIVK